MASFIPTPTSSEVGDEAGVTPACSEAGDEAGNNEFCVSDDEDERPGVYYSRQDLVAAYAPLKAKIGGNHKLPYSSRFANGEKDCEERPFGSLVDETQLLKASSASRHDVMAKIAYCLRATPWQKPMLNMSCMCFTRVAAVLYYCEDPPKLTDQTYVAANPPDYALVRPSTAASVKGCGTVESIEPQLLRVMLGYALQLDMESLTVVNLRVRQQPLPAPGRMRYVKVTCSFPFTVAIEN